MKKVLNFGSVNLDHVYHVPHFVQPGETLSSSSYQCFFGGKGLNQSIALRKGGADVYHAGMIGADGDEIRRYLTAHSVFTELIKTCNEKTGHAKIQVDSSGQNSILLFGGANQMLSAGDVREIVAHFCKGDILVLQNETSAVDDALCAAKAKGMQIVLNPSPITQTLLESHLEYVNWFILNEIEANAITGCSSVDSMVTRMTSRFPNAGFVLTLGDKGAILHNCGQTKHYAAYPAAVVDTTAAGDTFLGFFVAGLVRGVSAENAVRLANAASAITVTRKGASQSIPEMKEVKAFLENHGENAYLPTVR